MQIEQKIELLNRLGTAKLIHDIQDQENKLEKLLSEDAAYRSQNVKFLASYGEDCAEVKALLADLSLDPPLMPTGDGHVKKMTVAQVESWLRQQRSANPNLVNAIKTQNQVVFAVETNRIQIDMTKKRLESLKGLLGLRTAQIEFLRD